MSGGKIKKVPNPGKRVPDVLLPYDPPSRGTGVEGKVPGSGVVGATNEKRMLKRRHKGSGTNLSLSLWVDQMVPKDPGIAAAAKKWRHNKNANCSKPPLGLGCTREKRGGNSGGSQKKDNKEKNR